MKKYLILFFILSSIFLLSFDEADEISIAENTEWSNSINFVPDETTALQIAEATWFPIYGKEIYKREPFVATLNGDSIWHVKAFPEKKNDSETYHIEIRKSDGIIAIPDNAIWPDIIGFVPDEATAIKIAEATMVPVFGERIYERKPFTAMLKDNIWIVKSSGPPQDSVGGAYYIKIRKSDGKIIRTYFTR